MRQSRRDFMKVAGMAAAGCLGGTLADVGQALAAALRDGRRPNILWLSSEDICPDLGCYGDAAARTPTIDRLAGEGMRFTNCFDISGVCAPSRSALITGMYPPSIGTQHMRTATHVDTHPELPKPYEAVLPPCVKGFPEYLRAAGYYCTNNVKTDYQFGNPLTIWDECSKQAHWRNRSDKSQPFFAVFNHEITHESKIRTPAGKKAKRTDPAKVVVPPYYPDTPAVRNDLACYYDNIATMDGQVGEKLRQLAEDGLAENTIVFFFGDNGRGLPRAKRWIYDAGLHVPLIVRWPGRIEPGSVNEDLVSFVDFAPTVLSLAGTRVPAHMQGQPFLGGQRKPARRYVYAARDRMDEQYDFIRCVRDKRFKYIRNFMPEKPYAVPIDYMDQMPTMRELRRLDAAGKLVGPQQVFMQRVKPVDELYDITQDPHEIHNLAADPAYGAELKRLRAELEKWMAEIHDLGAVNEKEMVEKMWPGGVQPRTEPPVIEVTPAKEKGMVTVRISCPTEGASIAWTREPLAAGPGAGRLRRAAQTRPGRGARANGGRQPHWLLYSGPLTVPAGTPVRARAIRYGYKPSAVAERKG